MNEQTLQPASPDQRRAALAQAVHRSVRGGWRVESQTDASAALVKGKRPNHILHLLLSLLTAGVWAIFVWLPLCVSKHEHRRYLTVDEFGQVSG